MGSSGHYDALLARVYTWMEGGVDAAQARADAALTTVGLPPGGGRLAVDLGCGPGFHALALARMGYRVGAMDQSEALVGELQERAHALPVMAIVGDIQVFRRHLVEPAAVIVCLGDTLTHLQGPAAAERLIADMAGALEPGGWAVVSFRDYSGPPPPGDARFIPVRGDDERLLTCFLEYGETHVRVHDLLHTRSGDGWRLAVSSYLKARLSPDWVATTFGGAGLAVTGRAVERGMTTLVARRPPFTPPT